MAGALGRERISVYEVRKGSIVRDNSYTGIVVREETTVTAEADGYVSITLHSCNPFAIETENLRRLCESKGIPLLHIQTDFTPGDEAQIRTRIEAFIEMIRESKKEALTHE